MTFIDNLTLRKKITLLTTPGLVLGVAVFSFLSIRAVDQATETMLQDRLTTAHLVADYMDEVLGLALSELKTTAQMIESNGTEGGLKYEIETLEDVLARLSIHTSGTYLLNEEGRIIWSKSEAPELNGIDLSLYPSISQTIRDGEASISGLISVPVIETPVVLLSCAINKAQQRSEGVLVVAINPGKSSIGGFVQPIRLGNTGYVEIVDQNGIVVTRTDPGPMLNPFEKSDHSGRFAALIATGEPTRGVCHTCHGSEQKVEKRDVLAFAPLSVASWGVVIRQSEEEALAPARELRRNLLLFGGGLIAIAFLFVAITTRDVINRIRIITTASQRMAEGDLVSPIRMLGEKDEIGILAQTFNDMRTKLKASHEELEQMHRDIKRKDEIRGELLQDLFSIQEEERRRIARELHDETSQVIASITAHLEVARNNLPNDVEKVRAILERTQTQLIRILEEIHRLIYELRPTLLDDLGFVDSIKWLLDNNLKTAGLIVNFKTTGQVREFDNQLMTILFRVIQEAVYNIVKHAEARSVDVSLHFTKSSIVINIRDDGKGFEVEEAVNTKDRPRGLGLIGMMERVELAKGTMNIRSKPGTGTEIKIEIPLDQ